MRAEELKRLRKPSGSVAEGQGRGWGAAGRKYPHGFARPSLCFLRWPKIRCAKREIENPRALC